MAKAVPVTDESLAAAIKAGREYRERMPHATSVRYDRATRTFTLDMLAGGQVGFHVDQVPEIAGATEDQLADVTLSPSGGAVCWEQLDMHVSTVGLVMGAIAGPEWKKGMRQLLVEELQRAKTPKKAAAARLNGKKGGRPKKRTAAAS